jgi:hypothetical protein
MRSFLAEAMHPPRKRGFVLGELVVAVAVFTALVAFARSVETELDRMCVGAARTSSDAPQSRIVTDVRRWVCVSVSSDEPPENRYAADAETRTSRSKRLLIGDPQGVVADCVAEAVNTHEIRARL